MYLALCYGLKEVTAALMTTPATGKLQYLATSNEHYYFGNFLEKDICRITWTVTLSKVLDVLADQGVDGLRLQRVKFIRIPDEALSGIPQDDGLIDMCKHFATVGSSSLASKSIQPIKTILVNRSHDLGRPSS